jgi:hypothetical protein
MDDEKQVVPPILSEAEWERITRPANRYHSRFVDAIVRDGERTRAENQRLREALAFYADPGTYHACAFYFDPPTGGFDEDFDEDHGDEFYDRPMPGKTARAALALPEPWESPRVVESVTVKDVEPG